MGKKKPASNGTTKETVLAGTAPGAEYRMALRGYLPLAALCLASAALLAAAFPPARWTGLAHVALAPMLLAIVRSPKRWPLAVAAAAAGLIFYGCELYWFMQVDLGAYFGVMLYFLPFWPVFALLVWWTSRRTRLPLALLAPAMWVPLELARAYFLTGFPWLFLGHPQAASPHLLQVADIAGPYGLSALSAATAGLLVDLVTRPAFLRYGEKLRMARSLKLSFAVVLAAWAFVVAYGYWRLRPAPMRDGPFVVTVQSNVPQSVKGNPNDPSYGQLTSLTAQALKRFPEAGLVVWPETMVPAAINQGFLTADLSDLLRPGPGLEEARKIQATGRRCWTELHDLLAGTQARLLVGNISIELGDAEYRQYNSALLLTSGDRDYRSLERYDKVHLVPFGEYVPFKEGWPWLYRLLLRLTPYSYEYNLTPGTEYTRLEAGGATFSTPICFEDAFADVCREMVYRNGNKTGDFLVNISNDGWFAGTVELEQHWDLSVFRAVENRVPVVRSVNTGISGIIDSSGATVERVRTENGQVRSIDGYAGRRLALDARATFYGRHGDLFAYVLSLGAISIIIAALLRRRQAARP